MPVANHIMATKHEKKKNEKKKNLRGPDDSLSRQYAAGRKLFCRCAVNLAINLT
jgi:hypothetical protein